MEFSSDSNIEKKEYDAVVFDMDGVIFDSERATMNCWIELADKYGIKNIEEPFLACTGTTMARTREIMLEAYGESFPYDEYAKEALAREKPTWPMITVLHEACIANI